MNFTPSQIAEHPHYHRIEVRFLQALLNKKCVLLSYFNFLYGIVFPDPKSSGFSCNNLLRDLLIPKWKNDRGYKTSSHETQGIWFELLLLSYSCEGLPEYHWNSVNLWIHTLCLNYGIKYSIQHPTLPYSAFFCHYRRDGSILLSLEGGRCCNSPLLKKIVLFRLSLYFRPM